MAAAYETSAWNADASAIESLAAVQKSEDIQAVQAVLQTIYVSWLDESARHLQKQVVSHGYPGAHAGKQKAMEPLAGLCIVFVDGLRFDLAKSLDSLLRQKGLSVEIETS